MSNINKTDDAIARAFEALEAAREALRLAAIERTEIEQLEGELDTALEAELKLSRLGVEATARAEKAEADLVREVERTKELEARLRKDRNLEIDGKEAWRWGGDGEDKLESMSNGMAVLITAGDLRKVVSETAEVENAAIKEEIEEWGFNNRGYLNQVDWKAFDAILNKKASENDPR
ncbi:MAG: hypothetical protein U9Q07_03780 [Planctomycetota bacterium]|nr:hypothetical protein [Planctomycetota bacterium]